VLFRSVLGEGAFGVDLLFEFTPASTGALEQFAQTLDGLAVLGREAVAQQAIQRLVEVPVLHEVVGEQFEKFLDFEVGLVIAVPAAAESVADSHYRFRERYRARAPEASLARRLVRYRPSRMNSAVAASSPSVAVGPATRRTGSARAGIPSRMPR